MQPPLSDLDDTDRRILQVIDEEGVIRGSVLRRRARVQSAADFLPSVQKLLELGLIGVSGSTGDDRAAQEAYFSPVPSTRGLLKQAVTKR